VTVRRLGAVAALLLVGLVAGNGAGSAVPAKLLFGTKGRILRIAADGGRVAIETAARDRTSCDRVVVWNTLTRGFNAYRTGVHCGDNPIIEFLGEVALAGTRVAWIEAAGGNELDLTVHTATPGKKPSLVEFVENDSGATGGSAGDYVANLYGDGGLIAYDSWTEDDQGAVTAAALRILTGAKAKTIRRGRDTLDVVGVDAKRIAIQAATGPATIVSNAGALLKKIAVKPGTFAGAAFQGKTFVTLRGTALEVYDVGTGKLTKTITVPAKSRLDDVHDGLAVYRHAREVHVVRLSDGKQRVFKPPTAPVGAALEGPGLFYAYNLPKGTALGRVQFVPRATLVAMLR
jgi:hypothetical protein